MDVICDNLCEARQTNSRENMGRGILLGVEGTIFLRGQAAPDAGKYVQITV